METSEPDDRVVDLLLKAAFRAPSPAPLLSGPAPADAVLVSPRYRLGGEIGRGGVGIVLRGRDVELERDVAIKILKPEHLHHAGLTRRLIEEAQIGGQLEHPGIVPVHEFGRAPDGRPFFAMKLIQGRTLAELLKERRDPSDGRARWLAVFEQICQTVAYAHSRGVIHRDLKPANVILGAFGEVQVADWGLAIVAGRADLEPGAVLGTLAYMPPEQARGESERVDARSDVFALGATLCEILSGAPPYVGDSTTAFDAARTADLAPALARLHGCGADSELVELAKRCLAAAPQARPSHAGEVAEAVARHRAALQERARAAELAATAAQARALEERRARRLTAALAATVVVAVLAGGTVFLKSERDRRDRQEQAAQPVRDAIGRARELAAAARRDPPDAVGSRQAALAAADGALAAASAGDPGRALRDEATALRVELAAEVVRAEEAAATHARDAAALQRLGLVAGKMGAWGWDEVDVAFEQAFRDWGLDFTAMTDEQVIARLKSCTDPVGMCDFLLAWMGARATVAEGEEPRDFERMMNAMQLADPDPWRVRIRGAIPYRVGELVELVDDPRIWTVEPRTIAFLGSILGRTQFGDYRGDAVRFFRAAADRLPREFMIHLDLAGWLVDGPSPEWEDALGYASAAVAIEPDVSSAWLVLGMARSGVGDFDGATAALERALELEPRSSEARGAKAMSDLRCGRIDAALQTLRGASAEAAATDDLRFGLALAQLYAGDVSDARDGLVALLRSPHELESVARTADLLRTMGEAAAAEPALRDTLRLTNRTTTPFNVILSLRSALVRAVDALGRYEDELDELRVTEQLLGSRASLAASFDRAAGLARLQEALPDFQSGARGAESPVEAARVALLLLQRDVPALASELWSEAIAADEAAVVAAEPDARVDAARAALRAAAGEGEDAADLDAAARARHRGLAQRHLEAELRAAIDLAASDATARVRPSIDRLLREPALLAVRDPTRRALLPAEEAQAWEAFFAAARSALRRVRG